VPGTAARMRRLLVLLIALTALAGCGAGGGGSEEPKETQGTRQAGSEAEQLDAEGVSELSKLLDAVEVACGGGSGGGDASELDETVQTAVDLAKQNSEDTIVEINDEDRAPNFGQFMEDQAQFLRDCGEEEAAQRLASATFGPDEDTNASG
jgi:hypothetical protein